MVKNVPNLARMSDNFDTFGKFQEVLDMANGVASSTTSQKVTCNKSDTPSLTHAARKAAQGTKPMDECHLFYFHDLWN